MHVAGYTRLRFFLGVNYRRASSIVAQVGCHQDDVLMEGVDVPTDVVEQQSDTDENEWLQRHRDECVGCVETRVDD
jgi:hypothetical protein